MKQFTYSLTWLGYAGNGGLMVLTVQTTHKRQILDLTAQIAELVTGDGVVHVFVRHTTAALMLADLDPGTDQDLLDALAAMTPGKAWRHPHDPKHFPDHLWSALIGASVSIPYRAGQLRIGSWQRLVLVELDGPRRRQLEVTFLHAESDEVSAG